MTVIDMPRIAECTVSGCSYNHDGCHAFAVTVAKDASCATFIPLDIKGGLSSVTTQVGACQRTSCVHNKNLECTATDVRMGVYGDSATCLSYQEA